MMLWMLWDALAGLVLSSISGNRNSQTGYDSDLYRRTASEY